MRLDKAIKLFLGEHKPSTRKTYFYVLRDLAEFIGPGREVHEIPAALLIEYNHELLGRDYSPATVMKHVKSVKTFFNWCVNIDLASKSPARGMRQKKLPAEITRDKAMTDAELDAILDRARWLPRDYALILFLADTGCRAGGAAGLKIEDIDFENFEALVTEKGDLKRKVAFGERCRAALARWLLVRQKNAGPYVFSHNGRRMKADNLSQVIRRNCLKVGIRSLGSHSLRHRKGHQFADAKVAPSIAATALGHRDVSITLSYYYPRDWDTAKNELQKLAKGSNETPKIIKLFNKKLD